MSSPCATGRGLIGRQLSLAAILAVVLVVGSALPTAPVAWTGASLGPYSYDGASRPSSGTHVASITSVTNALSRITLGSAVVARSGSEAATGLAAEEVLQPSSLADEVANATGGVVKANKGGYTVEVPYGSRGITVRVTEQGGGRTNYYRVSVPGKAVDGAWKLTP